MLTTQRSVDAMQTETVVGTVFVAMEFVHHNVDVLMATAKVSLNRTFQFLNCTKNLQTKSFILKCLLSIIKLYSQTLCEWYRKLPSYMAKV